VFAENHHKYHCFADVNAFVRDAIKTDDDLLNFVNGFIYQRHSSGGRTVEIANRLGMKSVSEWMDPDNLSSRLNSLNQESLSPEKQQILRIARSELQRFKDRGSTPEQFDNDRFLD
jgi:hypothetical protein